MQLGIAPDRGARQHLSGPHDRVVIGLERLNRARDLRSNLESPDGLNRAGRHDVADDRTGGHRRRRDMDAHLTVKPSSGPRTENGHDRGCREPHGRVRVLHSNDSLIDSRSLSLSSVTHTWFNSVGPIT